MITQHIVDVVDFLIAVAFSRSEAYAGSAPNDCSESVAIFDELDALTVSEFAQVYAIYLLGSGEDDNLSSSGKKALTAEFTQVEFMSNDVSLHICLSRGLEAWRLAYFADASSSSS